MKHHDPGFLSSDLPACSWEAARFIVIPAPLEASVSYGGGTARGPGAILEASLQLEVFDGSDRPGQAGVFTEEPVSCDDRPVKDVLRDIGERVARAVRAEKFPILLGGEHMVTAGAVGALVEEGMDFGVVQFDAHADLRDTYEDNPLSHACVMRRVHELGVPVFQIGVRSLSEPEADYRETHGIAHLDAEVMHASSVPEPLLPDGFPDRIYVSFDVDAWDASLMPATGTPEPGGLLWHQAVDLMRRVMKGRTLLAADVVELAPIPGLHACDFTAAKMVYALMGLRERVER